MIQSFALGRQSYTRGLFQADHAGFWRPLRGAMPCAHSSGGIARISLNHRLHALIPPG